MVDGRRTGAVLIQIRSVAETGSTNADLLALVAGGSAGPAADGTWLRADRQTGGRGRQGRPWQSPPGNLYASTILYLRSSDPPAASFALVAAVALDEAVRVFLSSEAANGLCLKWPNDLLASGAKLSGILLERTGDAVVIGFGVNLAHHPDLPDRPTTSLAALGAPVDPSAFLEVLGEAMARWRDRWRTGGIEPIRHRWLERAHPPGTALTARLPDGTTIDGLFDGMDGQGALLLRLAGGERRVIHAADIFLI